MRNRLWSVILIGAFFICALSFTPGSEAQRRRGQKVQRAQVCGDPTVSCPGTQDFSPYDLPFRIPKGAVIYETEFFYAIILKSINAKDNCEVSVSENERLETQQLFPRNKVFADRCPEPGTIFYSDTNSDYRFMAVFAGRTRAEADRMLATVRATGKFPTANLRRMRAGFNGT